jgi:hypothetical protein
VTRVQQVEPQVSGLAGRGAGLPPHAGATAAPPLLQVQAALLQGPHDPILVVKLLNFRLKKVMKNFEIFSIFISTVAFDVFLIFLFS